MTAKYTDFRERMIMELIDFVQSQASVLSVAGLNRLIADLPALRERFTTIPSQTYHTCQTTLNSFLSWSKTRSPGRTAIRFRRQ
jgi:hypothetical protein